MGDESDRKEEVLNRNHVRLSDQDTVEPYLDRCENGDEMEEDDEDDGQDLEEGSSQLPRPPTKPNVYIDDESICPVCSQKGNIASLKTTRIPCFLTEILIESLMISFQF